VSCNKCSHLRQTKEVNELHIGSAILSYPHIGSARTQVVRFFRCGGLAPLLAPGRPRHVRIRVVSGFSALQRACKHIKWRQMQAFSIQFCVGVVRGRGNRNCTDRWMQQVESSSPTSLEIYEKDERNSAKRSPGFRLSRKPCKRSI